MTLLDVREADLLLHVADASIDRCEEHIAVVNGVLDEVLATERLRGARGARRGHAGAGRRRASVPTVLVLNKIDLVEDAGRRNALRVEAPGRRPDERRDGRRGGRASRDRRVPSRQGARRGGGPGLPRGRPGHRPDRTIREGSLAKARGGPHGFQGADAEAGDRDSREGARRSRCDSRRPHEPDGISRLNRSLSPSIVTHGYLRTISARCEARAGLAALTA